MERIGIPDSPYTGSAENSSLGLFYVRDEKGEHPLITVSINDKQAVKDFLERFQVVDADSPFPVGLFWSVGYQTDAETVEDSTTIVATMFRVGLGIPHEGEPGGEPEVVLTCNSVVPIGILKAWLHPVAFDKVHDITLSIIDGSSVMESSKDGDITVYKDGLTVASGSAPIFNVRWDTDEQTKEEARESYDTLCSKLIDDKLYADFHYKEEILYALWDKREAGA